MYYLIYKITNITNGMIYIGKHQTTNIDDNYMGSGVLIKEAQAQYGLKKFKKEILYVCKTKQEMNKIERTIVNRDFVARADTYNLVIGGSKNSPKKYKNAFYNKVINKIKRRIKRIFIKCTKITLFLVALYILSNLR